jgi:hypothetical protein
VDEDLWLKLDNGSLVWEIVWVALFHLGGQLLCPSLVFHCPGKRGTTGGLSQGQRFVLHHT